MVDDQPRREAREVSEKTCRVHGDVEVRKEKREGKEEGNQIKQYITEMALGLIKNDIVTII